MKIYRFDAGAGRQINRFGSDFVITRIARLTAESRAEGDLFIGCMHIGAGGLVGEHQAVGPQLFLVVAGTGWVRGTEPERRPITAYEAAFWEDGEWHEAGSETGMTALVIEGAGLDPGAFLPEA